MFLNTQSGSVLLAACSRRELTAGLPFAHRLWDVMLAAGASIFFTHCTSECVSTLQLVRAMALARIRTLCGLCTSVNSANFDNCWLYSQSCDLELMPTGRVPKTHATVAYMRALQEREPDWEERINQVLHATRHWKHTRARFHALCCMLTCKLLWLQCKQALSIDPGRLRRPVGVPQVSTAACLDSFEAVTHARILSARLTSSCLFLILD